VTNLVLALSPVTFLKVAVVHLETLLYTQNISAGGLASIREYTRAAGAEDPLVPVQFVSEF
jgi:hypothetical protein